MPKGYIISGIGHVVDADDDLNKIIANEGKVLFYQRFIPFVYNGVNSNTLSTSTTLTISAKFPVEGISGSGVMD